MTRIGLLSDTHGYMDEAILQYLKPCDEIWHAGDFGTRDVVQQLQSLQKPLRGVWGNIDGQPIRLLFPEVNIFNCEGVKVFMKHIGGYPPKYNPETKKQLLAEKPKLFISGHSHILKIMYDDKLECLHINPGAAGKQGWQKVRTLVRFSIDGQDIKDCEVVEMR
ncbi:MAG: metallophosphoesterase family protein [Niabella sp.]